MTADKAEDNLYQRSWDKFVDRLEDDLAEASQRALFAAWRATKRRLDTLPRVFDTEQIRASDIWADKDEIKTILDETFKPILLAAADEAAKTSAQLMGLNLPFESPRWARIAAARYLNLVTTTSERNGWPHQVAIDVTEAVTAGFQQGETTAQIATRVAAKLGVTPGDISQVGPRAMVIARTEANGLSNHVSYDLMESSGVVSFKKWYSVGDARTRGSHSAVNGTTIPFNQPFNVNGTDMMRPHDPTAPAKETVNCRCRLIPITSPQQS